MFPTPLHEVFVGEIHHVSRAVVDERDVLQNLRVDPEMVDRIPHRAIRNREITKPRLDKHAEMMVSAQGIER